MRTKLTVMSALLIVLAIASVVSSQTMPKDTIYSVVIYANGLNSATLSSKALEANLMSDEGVASVTVNPKEGFVVVKPKLDGNPVNLFNLMNRVNETKEGTTSYIVLKMKVFVIGHVVKSPAEYISTAKEANMRDRYEIQIGDTNLIPAVNSKLDALVKSGYEQAEITGVVTTFLNAVPIIVIADFKEPGKDTMAKLALTPKESIRSVKIYVDGFNDQNLSPEALKSNIMTEEGVAKVTIDKKNEAVIVTPKSDGPQISLYNLSKRVNETRQKDSSYKVIVMKVEAIGRIINPSGETEDESTEAKSRIQEVHRLQIGDIYFNLTENDKLGELFRSGLDDADINATVVRFNNTIPVVEVDSYDTATGETLLDIGPDPLDEMSESFEKEKETMKASTHAQIDSVRLYMNDIISPDFAESIKKDMSEEPGVEAVNIDSAAGVVEVSPQYGKPFDLYNIWHHINMLEGYKIIKADVVASGEITGLEGGYQADLAHPQYDKQYKLAAGNFIGFILAPSKVLSDLLESKNDVVTVIGTVTNFKERTPILDIKNFQKLEQRPDWLK